jgi:hypothetical protein
MLRPVLMMACVEPAVVFERASSLTATTMSQPSSSFRLAGGDAR